jgi:hypothetical protein
VSEHLHVLQGSAFVLASVCSDAASGIIGGCNFVASRLAIGALLACGCWGRTNRETGMPVAGAGPDSELPSKLEV